jgi:hypothetical protein
MTSDNTYRSADRDKRSRPKKRRCPIDFCDQCQERISNGADRSVYMTKA